MARPPRWLVVTAVLGALFRLVASWPILSPSAEANLVRRDGDAVLFLTARRFQRGVDWCRCLSQHGAPAAQPQGGRDSGGMALSVRGEGRPGAQGARCEHKPSAGLALDLAAFA